MSRFGRKCPQMLGGRIKKDMGGAESRFGRNCVQMLGGIVKKDMGGTSGTSILDLSTFHNKRVQKKEI